MITYMTTKTMDYSTDKEKPTIRSIKNVKY